MPVLEPPPVLADVLLPELLVGQHGGEKVLSLRRDQAEARHFRGRRHHQTVVGVNRADPETG